MVNDSENSSVSSLTSELVVSAILAEKLPIPVSAVTAMPADERHAMSSSTIPDGAVSDSRPQTVPTSKYKLGVNGRLSSNAWIRRSF